MKLKLKKLFTLEVELSDGTEKVINGTLAVASKTQKAETKAIFSKYNKETRELKKQTRQLARKLAQIESLEKSGEIGLLDAYEEFDELESVITLDTERLQNIDINEEVAFRSFQTLVKSDEKDLLEEYCKASSYAYVMETIAKDIEEKKGNDIKA